MTAQNPGVCWKQRFENYQKAFQNFAEAIELAHTRALSKLEEQGLIQAFEILFELSWKLLSDYLAAQGIISRPLTPRTVMKDAFAAGLLQEGELWFATIDARNKTSHVYSAELTSEIVRLITNEFYPIYERLEKEFAAYHNA